MDWSAALADTDVSDGETFCLSLMALRRFCELFSSSVSSSPSNNGFILRLIAELSDDAFNTLNGSSMFAFLTGLFCSSDVSMNICCCCWTDGLTVASVALLTWYLTLPSSLLIAYTFDS
ncbi:hypothetical protein BpHYR1_019068 [Brachionus plicatilis]|uniref:Uncharacterized protein n=1 Tax=Brachionus plicatilis TaxID=10195 RepID=A0A3M7SFQ8_BRAPC|nr:hypothetical protein BpHYR1_019068 [Brachionus plicatilis]